MREIVTSFLKVGATAYGGPAITGMMQAEFQERRQWVSKPQLAALSVFDRVRAVTWTRAAIQGIVPGVIGALAVSLVRIAPPVIPDVFAAMMYVAGMVVLLAWSVAPLSLVAGGAIIGVLRRRLGAAWEI